jgi:hypothetical protein
MGKYEKEIEECISLIDGAGSFTDVMRFMETLDKDLLEEVSKKYIDDLKTDLSSMGLR